MAVAERTLYVMVTDIKSVCTRSTSVASSAVSRWNPHKTSGTGRRMESRKIFAGRSDLKTYKRQRKVCVLRGALCITITITNVVGVLPFTRQYDNHSRRPSAERSSKSVRFFNFFSVLFFCVLFGASRFMT